MFETFESRFPSQFGSTNNQLKDFIFRMQENLFSAGEACRDQIRSVEALKEYNKEMRRNFIENIGGIPKTDEPLEAEITSRREYSEFTLENIILKVDKGNYITASMYLPKDLAAPGPAVLFVCGHSHNGRMYDPYQVVCQTLVRAGLIVFAIDPTGQGERSNFYDPETGKYLAERATPDHDACGVPSTATDRFLQSYILFDEMRAVDYMLTRPEIDPARIGVTGNSGGGTQTAAMMICDDRIAAAAPGTFITNRREYMYTGQPQDSEQIWPGLTGSGYDHVNAFMMFAPKPAAILAVDYDFFCIEGTQATYDEAKRFYELFGKGDNLRLCTDRFTHCYTPALAVAAAEFFTEVFFGEKRTVSNDDIQPLPEEQMYASRTGQVLADLAEAIPMQVRVKEAAAALTKQRRALSSGERLDRAKTWLSSQVYKGRQPVDFRVRLLPEENCPTEAGYMGIPVCWKTQHRLFSFGVIIKEEQYRGKENLPTVIAIWEDGTDQIHAHADWIRQRCREGKQVLVMDVPGVGEMRQAPMTKHAEDKARVGTLYTLCGDLLYSGDNCAAMHCYDVLRAIEMVSLRFLVAPSDITLYCDGPDGVYGIMAGFLNEKVRMEYGPALLRNVERELIEQEVFQYDNSLCLIVPGMLKYFDYEELMR